MNRHAIAYVNSLGITDAIVRAVLQLLAERTDAPGDHRRPEDIPDIMGLHLQDSDVPALAVRAGLDPQEFRQQLRALKQHVKMDVLEHSDGLWEIVYGPSYTRPPKPRPAEPDLTRGGRTRSGSPAGRSTAPGATSRTRADTSTCTRS
ncbi:hypothetical protein ABZZ79_37280 [Streptomyces sp. NPDC006458]|uniref:hypothetical protein n=1 Tax=Streptomyces sp. NPDC006458 TaxID=3154302 RepID=UPI0033B94FE1